MNESGKAVFLSYASQDSAAAKRICEALRSGGVEVWFDADGGLEHGDEWDAKIRRQIKECVLFIPVISSNTQAREEGYFRIEWELAAQRALGIASGVPFILPVVIDDTKEPAALVPDRFHAVQWTRLRGGEVPTDVLQRFLKLWSHRTGVLKHEAMEPERPRAGERDEGVASPTNPLKVGRRVPAAAWSLALLAIALTAGGYFWMRRSAEPAPFPAQNAGAGTRPPTSEKAAPATPAAPLSEARKLALRAQALIETLESTREDYQLAEELVAQAKAKDTTDAEVCAIEAHIHESYIQRGWDTSDTRRESARTAVQRAIRLDPASFEARFSQARLLGLTGREGEERERQLRELRRERPADQRILRALATVIDRLGRIDESAAIAKESAALPGGDPLALYSLSQGYWFAGRAHDAEVAIEAAIAQKPFTGALLMNVWYKASLRGDIAQARQLIEQVDLGLMQEDRAAYFAFSTELLGRNPDKAIAWLKAVPRDWLNDSWYRGPKGQLVGEAHALAGRPEAARLEWQSALKLTEQRLVDRPKDPPLLRARVQLLARLGQPDEAARQLSVLLQIVGVDAERATIVNPPITDCFIALGRKAEALRQMASFVKNGPNWRMYYSSATLRLDPTYDSLRAEPEFTALLAEVEAREKAIAAPAAVAKSNLTAIAPAKVDDKSVAVLAFANLSDDKANEYFSDGISEELLNVLAKIPGLKVSARTSAFYFKGKEVPIPEIAKQLGVAYVVEGSVRKQGDKVRITAQLIKADGGFHVWSDTFTRDLKDVFAVQDEIAGLIAKNLELKMGLGEATARLAVSPDAYQAFLIGRAAAAKASTEELREAVGHFERAVALEPKYTAAWVQLASAHTQLGRWGGAPTLQSWQSARAAIDRARTLEPDSPDVLLALGWILRTAEWKWREAEQAFRRALELRPNHPDTVSGAAVLLFNVGKKEEAFRLGRQAVQLDPLNAAAQIDLSLMFYSNENWPESEQAARRALQLAPGGTGYHSILAWSLVGQRRYAEAETEAALETDELSQATALGILAIDRGQGAAVRAQLARFEEMARANGDSADLQLGIAMISASLGEKDRAFAALEKARASRDPSLSWLKNEWRARPLHSDPRWNVLLHQVGLADDQLK